MRASYRRVCAAVRSWSPLSPAPCAPLTHAQSSAATATGLCRSSTSSTTAFAMALASSASSALVCATSASLASFPSLSSSTALSSAPPGPNAAKKLWSRTSSESHALASFFARFPEGTYEIEGISLDGVEIESETEITHAMPAPPVAYVNDVPTAQQCDDEEEGYDAPVIVAEDYVISWEPVTMTHPELGYPQGASGLVVVNYEVVVETDLETDDGEEFTTVFSAIVPPDVTEMTIPAEFLEQSDEFKYEVLVREESWNQTAVESCFLTEDDD